MDGGNTGWRSLRCSSGARGFISISTTCPRALPIYVVAKQWMWKVQHPGGQREINELHIPVGPPVRLIMASQDVIHSFLHSGVPRQARRAAGPYQEIWFEAAQGRRLPSFLRGILRHRSFPHDRPDRGDGAAPDSKQWLARQDVDGTLASEGAESVPSIRLQRLPRRRRRRCARRRSQGFTASRCRLQRRQRSGVADERYIRDSILKPRTQIAAGYAAADALLSRARSARTSSFRIVAYIKSLADDGAPR